MRSVVLPERDAHRIARRRRERACIRGDTVNLEHVPLRRQAITGLWMTIGADQFYARTRAAARRRLRLVAMDRSPTAGGDTSTQWIRECRFSGDNNPCGDASRSLEHLPNSSPTRSSRPSASHTRLRLEELSDTTMMASGNSTIAFVTAGLARSRRPRCHPAPTLPGLSPSHATSCLAKTRQVSTAPRMGVHPLHRATAVRGTRAVPL